VLRCSSEEICGCADMMLDLPGATLKSVRMIEIGVPA
jgi:hypothetical protein